MEKTRRQVMRTGAATAGALAAGSLAGCGWIPFLGGSDYASWVPDPTEFQESESVTVFHQKPSEIAQYEDNFNSDYYDESVETDFESIDVDFEQVTSHIIVLSGFSLPIQVVDGDYENQTVVDALEDDETGSGPFAKDGEYEGYGVYLNDADDAPDDPETAFGVNGTLVVQTSSTEDLDAEEMLELAIDTKNGDSTPYTEENEDFSTVVDEVGDGSLASASVREDARDGDSADAETGDFENEIANGSRSAINGDTIDYKYVVVWDSESDADEGDLEDYADNGLDDEYSPNGDPSISVSGRIGTIEFTFDTDELETDS